MALDHFEPDLVQGSVYLGWMDDWPTFVHELQTEFGPVDPEEEAADAIDHLKMQENQHIMKYNVAFNRLAKRTGWGENTLRHRYYAGLAERIKDVLAQSPKPKTLRAVREHAQIVDARYWERSREKGRPGNKNNTDPGRSDRSDRRNNPRATSPTPNSAPVPSGSSTTPVPGSNNRTPASRDPSVASKLGKDGKLLPDERKRRLDNNLCLFCGSTGHQVKECPKSKPMKARAAALQEEKQD